MNCGDPFRVLCPDAVRVDAADEPREMPRDQHTRCRTGDVLVQDAHQHG